MNPTGEIARVPATQPAAATHVTETIAPPPAITASARLREVVGALFAVDLRSLASLRIGLGIAILLDLALRAVDLRLLYTDHGALPRDVLIAMQGRGALLSIHYWASADVWLQALVFAINAACAVALLVGWRTWPATLACWYFASSLQIRQPLVYMGGDSLLRLLLFWSLFLPLAARFSVDAARGRIALRGDRLLSGGTIALLLQVCLVYWATGFSKDGALWQGGQAVFYALHSDMATPFGVRLRDASPGMLELLTHGTLAIERFGPFLAFVPFWTPAFRLCTIALFVAFHLGLAAAMNIGLFPVFSMVAWLAFVPTEAWNRFRTATRTDVRVPGMRAHLVSVAAAVAILYVAILLAERTRLIPRVLPGPVNTIGWALRLQQTWDMFAPNPHTQASTFFIRRTASDGTTMRVPAADTFRSQLYLGYLQALPPAERDAPAYYFARHWCGASSREFERGADITRVTLVVERREIDAEGFGPPNTSVLIAVPCGD